MSAVIDVLNKVLGDPNEKELKRLWPLARKVRSRSESPEIQALQLPDLPKKTEEFKQRIAAGAAVDDLLEEAFAVCIRACQLIVGKKATLGAQEFAWDMVPFDEQILGGIVLHKGNIAEMKTGEGKTLVCTLPVYLNALAGKGVHVVTVNDYLAKRDALWMGMLYEALGLKVGTIIHDLDSKERREAYASDVTYGTNNEFGFDYLRDNMAPSIDHQVQRGLHYAIVDEVDSILIDEARTPLIISQPGAESTVKYMQYAKLVRELQENTHYNKDEKQRVATLTEEGVKKMESLLGVENIFTEKGFEEVHHIEQALRAHAIYQRDVDYVVKDGEIIIVDEFTGRLMPGRRYGHGLHQAIEAKENVEVQRESKTLATITFQNYFRLYGKMAGMTGTAKTEEEEFESIYKVRTIVVPTHRDMVRTDKADSIYRTVKGKFEAVARIAKEKHAKGQPVLVGTTSIEKSEVMSLLLQQMQVPHQVLNAKQHQKEAEIVAQAGQKRSVTIATNMAGRGTDIKLGEGVADLGGLAILGTERHESRRIDNQLRGRSGRQGDPGESQFFVSMEDDLMRLFGGDRLKTLMEKLNVPEDQPLENGMVSRSIESAQKRVEGRNFDIRRHVVQYDDVMNMHRTIIYARRQKILERLAEDSLQPSAFSSQQDGEGKQSLHQDVLDALQREAETLVNAHASDEDPEVWNLTEIYERLKALHPQLGDFLPIESMQKFGRSEQLNDHIVKVLHDAYEEKCRSFEEKIVRQAERVITLRAIDTHWMAHIDDMAHLREQVSFAGYAQRDPLIEYKDQGFQRFRELLAAIDSTIIQTLLQVDFAQFAPRRFIQQAEEEIAGAQTNEAQIEAELADTGVGREAKDNPVVIRADEPLAHSTSSGQAISHQLIRQTQGRPSIARQNKFGLPAGAQSAKVGRNDPCPCGSGKKFKKCHGR
ncbi:MAG TPA: preprotein translocase subunit SecA [Candidatus Peribacteraceae bacterium]|nr:preprotein translocase subunit SecA [Candidatus Peribacteraceae bacterium]